MCLAVLCTGDLFIRLEIVRYCMCDGKLYFTECNGLYGILGVTAWLTDDWYIHCNYLVCGDIFGEK